VLGLLRTFNNSQKIISIFAALQSGAKERAEERK
jgi:hypothetical protein